MISNVYACKPEIAVRAEENTARQMAALCDMEGKIKAPPPSAEKKRQRFSSEIEALCFDALKEPMNMTQLMAACKTHHKSIRKALNSLMASKKVIALREKGMSNQRYVRAK